MRSALLLALALAATLAQAAPPDAGSQAAKEAVTAAMRSNFAALMTLQPYLVSPTRFADPANAEEIRHQLDILQKTPHAFPGAAAGQEPGLAAITQLFGGYLKEVRRRFDSGNKEYARSQLRTATAFCFGCHTRVGAPTDFEDVEKQVANLGVSELDRADLYAATRQFDAALDGYRRILAAPAKGELGFLTWIHAARSSLRIAVRVKASPELAGKLLSAASGRADLPPFVQEYVAAWRRDVKAWHAEKLDPSKLSAEQLVAKAKALIGPREGLLINEQRDVPMLRATHYLHEALSRDPKGKHRGEALYLLGVAYGVSKDPLLWELDGLYFEACIREGPHTPNAKRCFQRLQDEVYFGYTGSGGTQVPAEELERLSSLRQLAY